MRSFLKTALPLLMALLLCTALAGAALAAPQPQEVEEPFVSPVLMEAPATGGTEHTFLALALCSLGAACLAARRKRHAS